MGKLQSQGRIYFAYSDNKYVCVQNVPGEAHRKEPIKAERLRNSGTGDRDGVYFVAL